MPFGTINDLIDVVNFIQFHVNPFSGCGATIVQKLKPSPNANYKTWGLYRASCDN
jgi:hypothetical protein